MTGAAEWTQPTVAGINGLTFQVLVKPVKRTPSWDTWVTFYSGTAYKFVCGGLDSARPLRSGTQYEFKVACQGRFGKCAKASQTLVVETLADDLKKGAAEAEPDLPPGWVECW
jgi:hypothetical protein